MALASIQVGVNFLRSYENLEARIDGLYHFLVVPFADTNALDQIVESNFVLHDGEDIEISDSSAYCPTYPNNATYLNVAAPELQSTEASSHQLPQYPRANLGSGR